MGMKRMAGAEIGHKKFEIGVLVERGLVTAFKDTEGPGWLDVAITPSGSAVLDLRERLSDRQREVGSDPGTNASGD